MITLEGLQAKRNTGSTTTKKGITLEGLQARRNISQPLPYTDTTGKFNPFALTQGVQNIAQTAREEEKARKINEITGGQATAFRPMQLNVDELEKSEQIWKENRRKEELAKDFLPQVGKNLSASVASGLANMHDMANATINKFTGHHKLLTAATQDLFEPEKDSFNQAQKEVEQDAKEDRERMQWARDYNEYILKENEKYDGLAKGVLNAVNVAGNMYASSPAGVPGLFLNSAGAGYNQALQEGAREQDAYKYGLASGALETGVEMLSGGAAQKLINVPALGKVAKLTDNIDNKVLKFGVNVLADVGGEGIEEGITALADPYIQKITYNPNAGYQSVSEALSSMGEAFKQSILPTLLMGGTSTTINGINSLVNKQISVINSSNLSQNEKQVLINQVQQEAQQIIQNAEKNVTPQSPQAEQTQPTNEVIPPTQQNQNTANMAQNNANVQNNVQNDAKIQQSLGINQENTQVPTEIQTFVDARNKTSPGLKVEIDSSINTDGVIIKNADGTRVMKINPNSTRKYEFVAVHEMLHDLENTPEFKELSEFVKQRAITHENFEKAKQAITEQYQKYYQENNLDMSGLNMEIETTNDMVAQALGNPQFLNELAGQKPNVFMRLYNWIKNVAFDGRNTGKTFTERRADNKYLQELKKKFETAYNTAYKGNSGQQFDIITTADNKRYAKATRQVIKGNDASKWGEQVEKYINEEIRKGQDVSFYGADGELLTITRDTAGKAKFRNEVTMADGTKRKLTDDEYKAKLEAETHIDELAQISKHKNGPVADTKNHSFAKDGFNYRTAYFEDSDAKYYKITMSVGKNGEINTIYNVGQMKNAQKNRSNTSNRGLKGPSDKIAKGSTTSTNSIPSQSQSVNNISESSFSISQNLPKTDNQGRELSKGQQEYFKDSKVRDKEGRLLEVYHGTESTFNIYKSQFGEYFFTDNENASREYGGKVKKQYLNLKNPYIVDFEGGNDKGIFDAIDYAKANGYDGVIAKNTYDGANTHNQYVVFNPNQIKNVDNLNPTENPDIRYSQSNDEWAKYLSENWDLMANARKAPTLRPQQAEQEAKRMNLKKPKLEEIAELTAENAQLPKGSYKQNADKMTAYRRKFWDNVESSKIIGQNIKDKVNMTNYERKTNDDTLNKMKERLDTDPVRLTQEWWAKDIKKATDQDIALGAILLERYQQEGRFDEAVDVVQKLADIGTEAGRTVQMYSIFQRLTPEGMQIYQQRKLNSALENITKKQTGKWVEQNKDKFKLTEDDSTFITAKVQEAQNASTERQKQIALAEIEKRINDKLPPEAGQSVKAFRRIAMLFNPKTQVRNVVGNTTVMPLNYVTDLVATGIDKAIARKTGVRTTTLPSAKTVLKGAKKGLVETWDDYRKGIRTTPTGTKYEIQNNVKSFNENTGNKAVDWVNNKLNGIDRILSSVMEAGDRPFYEAAYQNSLQGQMKANGVTEPTQDMIDIASNVALSQTWQDSNNYTQAVLGIRSAFNKINIHGFGLGDLIIPFAKTPANLTKAMVEYSPAGLIPTIINYNDMRKAISRGDMTPMQQKKFVTSVGKAAAGTLLYVLANSLVQSGAITGSSDEDKDVANFEKNVLGIQPYSIRIGDKTYTYNWAQPLAAPLAIMADAHKMSAEGAELNDILLNTLKVGGDQLVANSFLQGIQELLSSQYSNESMMDNLVGAIMDLPTQFTPTLLGQIATYTDATKRQTYENGDAVGTMVNEVKNKIPGKKETLAPQVNTFGEEILNYGGDNSAFNVFFNPGNISSANATDTQKELYALYEATQDTTIFPRQAPYSVSGGGEKVSLSSKDRAEYQKASGQYVTKELDALFDSNFYKSLENEQKAEIVNKIVSDADTTAKSKWVETTTTAQLADKQEKLENASIPLVDYYNSWAAQKDIEGIPGPDGKTLSGSKSRLKKEAIDKATADLNKYQRRVLYEMFNIGESVW